MKTEQAFLFSSSSPQTKNSRAHVRTLLPGVQRTSCLATETVGQLAADVVEY